MSLFRKSPEKIAQKAEIRTEIERLRALSDNELAIMLLPPLGPDGINPGSSSRPQQLCIYLLREFPGSGLRDELELMSSVRRGLERLEQLRLVRPISHQRSPVWRITHLGEETLASRTVEQRVTEGT